MRRSLMLVPVLALLVLTPTGAQAADDDVVCDAPPEGYATVGPGASLTPAVASPQFEIAATFTDFNYQLDLSPATAVNKASISSTMTWQIVANDWDLFLLDGDGGELALSEGFQPFDPAEESVAGTIKHCDLFTIRVFNFQAVGGPVVDAVDPLQLTVTTGNKK